MCVLKSNSNDQYAITFDVNAYHSVHFVSIKVIYKCQLGIDFCLLMSAQDTSSFMNKISVPSPVFPENDNTEMKVKLCKYVSAKCQQEDERFASVTIKSANLILKKGKRWE